MEEIHYRKAVPEDANELAVLRAAFLAEIASADANDLALRDLLALYFANHLKDGQFLGYLAEANGKIIATSGMVYHRQPPAHDRPAGMDAHVVNIYTLPDFRRRGIAARLLKELIIVATDIGCDRVTLQAMPLGRSVYIRSGFAPVNQEMQLDLREPQPPPLTDDELIRQFESCELPFSRWTHRAHVKVAYTYLSRHPFDEALQKIRAGIKKYNAHNKVPEGPTSGYNETTTTAFAHLIAATIKAYGPVFRSADADSFCDTHPHLLTRNVLRLFYSPAQRMHPLAKTQFVEPDLSPLPRICE